MASAMRSAILGHVRVPVVAIGSKHLCIHGITSVRSMSSHDDHLQKTQVIDRILDIVKAFPKVDPSKVLTYILLIVLLSFCLIRVLVSNYD